MTDAHPVSAPIVSDVCFDDVHELVNALAAALDAKHSYTRGHSERVAELASAVAVAYGLDERQRLFTHVAGHLHDIGKIGVPDAVLMKAGRLSDVEFEAVKRHPTIGFDILDKVESLRPFADTVRHHHERFDGSGYPDGLRGDEIPLAARIICLVDSYDAMTSRRAYRASMTPDQALGEIIRCRGTQFDPRIVDAFFAAHASNGAAGGFVSSNSPRFDEIILA